MMLKRFRCSLSLVLILLGPVILIAACGSGAAAPSQAPTKSEIKTVGKTEERKEVAKSGGAPPSAAQPVGQPVKLKFRSIAVPTDPNVPLVERWIELVKQNSGGTITMDLFHTGQLVPDKDVTAALRNRTFDVLWSCPHYYTGELPIGDFSDMGLGLEEYEDIYDVWHNSELESIVNRHMGEKFNARMIPPVSFFNRYLFVRKGWEANSLKDLQGAKTRVGGILEKEVVTAYGGSPIHLVPAEIYTAMQRGTVDAVLFPIYAWDTLKFGELTGTILTPPTLKVGFCAFMINLDAWKSLSPEQQSVLDKVSRDMEPDWLKAGQDRDTEYFEGILPKAGVKIVKLSDEEQKVIDQGWAKAWEELIKIAGEDAKKIQAIYQTKRSG